MSLNHDTLTEIHVVGLGLDGGLSLRPDIQVFLQKATFIIGSDRHLGSFPSMAASTYVLGSLETAIARIHEHLNHSSSETFTPPLIVILASGDPLFFGIGRLLLQEFSPQNITFHPHLSSIQLAFSRIKEPWNDAVCLSIHGRTMQTLEDALKKSVNKIAVLTDHQHSPDAIARLLIALDRPHQYDVWVCEELGGANEKVAIYSAPDLAEKSPDDFSALNVVILIRQRHREDKSIDVSALPVLGIPDSYFASFGDRPGLMTKREMRLMILGELALTPKSTVWDIGAGTGSVSVEIARICPGSIVYAIEKTTTGNRLIQTNAKRFQLTTICPVQGIAPQCLAELPTPTHVFIGGSGGTLIPSLNYCIERLEPDGTLVVALVTLERLTDALQWTADCTIRPRIAHHHLVLCNVARSVPVGPLTRLSPLNPVHLLTIQKAA